MPSLPHALLTYPVLIEAGGATASGFFMSRGLGLYLVTAKHVLFKNGIELYPTVALTAIHDEAPANKAHYEIDCPVLFDSNHLRKHAHADVAVAKIASLRELDQPSPNRFQMAYVRGVTANEPDHFSVRGLDATDTLLSDHVGLAADIILIGYPTSLAGEFFEKGTPLLRAGIVAGRTSKGEIVIDCPVYFGNSGAVVLARAPSHLLAIGVASRMIPFQERLYSLDFRREVGIRYENSGYTIVEPMDRVFELLNEEERPIS